MTACASRLQHLSYVSESAFGEASSSMSGAQTIPHTGRVDVSTLKQSFIEVDRAQQYKNAVSKKVPGPWAGAQFTFEFELAGHGGAVSGAVTVTELENLIAWVFGTAVRTATAGHTIGVGSTASALVTAAAPAAMAPGGLFRVGSKGDGRADGQWGVVETFAGTALASETAFPGSPTNGDVIHAAVNIHTVETTCAVDSKRFAVKTSDGQWVLHGCVPLSAKLMGGNAGELLKVQCTVHVSWAEPVSTTFPDTTTTAAWTFNGAPNAAGGVFLQDAGTVTRQILACRSLSIDFTLGIKLLTSYDTANGYSIVGGAKRTQDICKVQLVIDADGPSATPTWFTKARANTPQHLLVGYSVGVGTAVACYMPYLVWDGDVPIQNEADDLNRVTLSLQAGTDVAETASDLASSMIRWGLA